MARLLAGHLAENVQAPPNYSVRMSAAGRSGFHRLLEGDRTTLVRTRSVRRLLWALCAFLDSHAAERDTAAVHVDALVLVYQGWALLLPRVFRHAVLTEDELRQQGFRILDAPTAALDSATGELLVRPPTLDIDEGAFGEADAFETGPAYDPPTVRPGRYPVCLWVDMAYAEVPTTPSRAVLVAQANRAVRNRTAVGPQAALSALARAAEGTRPFAVPAARYRQRLLEQLREALDEPATGATRRGTRMRALGRS